MYVSTLAAVRCVKESKAKVLCDVSYAHLELSKRMSPKKLRMLFFIFFHDFYSGFLFPFFMHESLQKKLGDIFIRKIK